jgi:hypothetical protein
MGRAAEFAGPACRRERQIPACVVGDAEWDGLL